AKRPADRPASAGWAIAALAAAVREEEMVSTRAAGAAVVSGAREAEAKTFVERKGPSAGDGGSPPRTTGGTMLLEPPPPARIDAHAATAIAGPIALTQLSAGVQEQPAARAAAPPSIVESVPRPPLRSNAPAVAVVAVLLVGAAAL